MKRIPKFRANIPLASQLTHQTMNAIVEAIEERTPMTGKGTRLRQTNKGFTYSADPGAGRRLRKLPFQCSNISIEDDIYTVEVEPSTVTLLGQSRIPTINGTPMNERDEETELYPRIEATVLDSIWLRIQSEWTVYQTYYETELYEEPVTYKVYADGGLSITSVSIVALPYGTPELESQYQILAEADQTTMISYFQIGTSAGANVAYGPAMATPVVFGSGFTGGGSQIAGIARMDCAFSSLFLNE